MKSFKQVSKRFPSLQSLVSAGLMTEAEAELYQGAELEVGGDFQVSQCPAANSLSTKSNLSLKLVCVASNSRQPECLK